MKHSFKLFLLLLVALYSSSYAQLISQFKSESILNAPYVFEGVIIDTMYYNGETGRRDDLYLKLDFEQRKVIHSCKPMTSHKINITNIFRGNLNPGTIDLVVEGGIYTDYGLFINEPDKGFKKMDIACDECFHPMPIGTKGIFFCSQMSTKWKNSPMQVDNEIRVVPMEIVDFSVRDYYKSPYSWEKEGHGFKVFGKIFSTKEEFYQFLSQYPNITIPKEEIKEQK